MGGGGGEGIEGSALEECAVEGIDGEDGARGKCGDGGREAERVAEPVVPGRRYASFAFCSQWVWLGAREGSLHCLSPRTLRGALLRNVHCDGAPG